MESGNVSESCSLSNIRHCTKVIPNLMSKNSILKQINKNFTRKKKLLHIKSEVGFEKLAFGDISDCIRLIFAKNIDDFNLKNMNLFNISEIKKLKDGSIEIKFFDRMKAMEKIQEFSSENSDKILPLYSALENGIKKISKDNDND